MNAKKETLKGTSNQALSREDSLHSPLREAFSIRDLKELLAETSACEQKGSYLQRTGLDSRTVVTEIERSHFTIKDFGSLYRAWQRLPDKQYLRFQQLFSPNGTFFVPAEYALRQGGELTAPVSPTSERRSLLPLVIDPTLVSFSLAERCGLASSPESKLTEREKLKLVSSSEVVNGIKYLFETLKPLGKRNFRVQVIADYSEGVATLYAPLLRHKPETLFEYNKGVIFYTSERFPGAKTEGREALIPRRLVVNRFESVYDAARKTDLQMNQYHKEQDELVVIATRWKQFVRVTLPQWTSIRKEENLLRQRLSLTASGELRCQIEKQNQIIVQSLKSLLSDSIEIFKGAIHRDKRKIYAALTKITESLLNSPSERINPNPVTLQLCASISRSCERLLDIRIKDGFNQHDHDLFKQTIKESEDIFRSFGSALEQGARCLGQKLELFSKKPLSAKAISSQVEGLNARLNLPIEMLSSLKVRPFTTFSSAIGAAHRNFLSACHSRDLASTQSSYLEMYLVSKLVSVNKIIENIRSLTNDPNNSLHSLTELANSAKSIVAERRVFPELHLGKAFNLRYKKLAHDVTRLSEGLHHYNQERLQTELRAAEQREALDRNEFNKRLRKYIDSFDLLAILPD